MKHKNANENKTRKLSFIIILIILIGILTYTIINVNINSQNNNKLETTITIGATLPITGFVSEYGNSYKNGLLMAQEKINNRGGINNKKLIIDFSDNQADAKKVVNDVTYFTEIKNYSVIYNSMEYLTIASKDIAENDKKIMITFTTHKFNQDENPRYVFRDYWDMELIGEDFGKVLSKDPNSQIGYLALNDQSYLIFKKGIEKTFNKKELETQIFNFGEKDFKTQLMKIKNNKQINTIVIYGFPNEMDLILKQMAELDMYDYDLYLTEAATNTITQNNKEILQKTNAITSYGSTFTDNQQFIKEYKKRYNHEPMPDAYYIYDNLIQLSKAMIVCDEITYANDPECIKEQIKQDYDEFNNKYRELPIVEFNNGWNIIET